MAALLTLLDQIKVKDLSMIDHADTQTGLKSLRYPFALK